VSAGVGDIEMLMLMLMLVLMYRMTWLARVSISSSTLMISWSSAAVWRRWWRGHSSRVAMRVVHSAIISAVTRSHVDSSTSRPPPPPLPPPLRGPPALPPPPPLVSQSVSH